MKVIIKSKHCIKNIIREGCKRLKKDGKLYWGGIEITTKNQYKEVITNFFKNKTHKGYSTIVVTPFINTKQLCKLVDKMI